MCLIADVLDYAENYNLVDVITPVNANKFRHLLQEAGYPAHKTKFLYEEFSWGFSLEYHGSKTVKLYSKNLRVSVGNPTILWNKVIKEVRAGRFAGPYLRVPFESFIQSLISLVPKDQGRDMRLIFHLSHPKLGDTSVNCNTPKNLCSVNYADFNNAVRICCSYINGNDPIFVAKSDILSAFRNLGLDCQSWRWTVLKVVCPMDGKMYYFVDKCLPFGSSISCALFQKVSDGIAFLVQFRTKLPLCNYLDNYLFVAAMKCMCDWQVKNFPQVCQEINMPVSNKKTYWATTNLTFLGFLLDGINKLVLVPLEKIQKALDLIEEFLQKGKKKVTVHRLQQLCGFLNFLCRCIVPGHAFTCRLYAKLSPKLRKYNHIAIYGEMRSDLQMWKQFMSHPSIFCHSFTDFSLQQDAKEIDLFTDSSRNFHLGGGGVCDCQWFFVGWDPIFLAKVQPSIEYLELYSLTIGVVLWIHKFCNSKVFLFCDNKAVMHMVNNTTSGCWNCMVLIRLLVLQGLKHNVVIKVKYVRSKDNARADAISRRKFQLFHKLTNFTADKIPLPIPEVLWPMSKIWVQ